MNTIYFSLPCIPPQFSSKLDNIFLTLLFNEKNRIEFGNKSAFLLSRTTVFRKQSDIQKL